MRYAIMALLVAPLWAQETGGATGADPARFFPADTFAYAEADASALGECLPEWQIARILTDPALKPLFRPALEKLGLDPEKPVEALMKQFPPGDFFEGRAAVGVRGISVAVRDGLGKEWRFRVSPDAPFDAKAMFRLFGMMLALDVPGGRKITFDMDVDFLAVARPGPSGKRFVAEALANMGGVVTQEQVKVLGLDATHARVDVPVFEGLSYAFNFYAAEQAGTWFLATQTDVLEQALGGGPRASLAASPALKQARARFTSGRPLLLAHVDLALALGACRGFVPPIAGEMGEISGINAVRGLGFGVSLVDGGLRESVGIVLDGKPRGIWRLLEGMPAGLRSIEVAPPGALAALAVKLDMTVLRERIRAFCADVVPGNEDEIEREISREMAPAFDLVADILPALGDEAAVFVYPAGTNELFPGFVLGADARDEAALARLVAKVQAQVPADVAKFVPADLPEGIKAVQVIARTPYTMHFAIHKGHFFLASSPKLLSEAFTRWGAEGSRSLVRDDPILPLVLKSANGGDTKNLAALGYVNLRACGAEAMKSVLWWRNGIPAEWLDPKQVAEIHRVPNHLTGAAIALRHDKDGVVLDCFSPVGLLVPMVAVGIVAELRVIEAQQIAIPQRAGTGRPSLGINTKTSDGTGVKVLGLVQQGAAARGGLRQGDKIVGMDGVVIATMEDLEREMAKKKPGETVGLKIRRGDGEIAVTVELGEEQEAGW
jgi:hypothetical protein